MEVSPAVVGPLRRGTITVVATGLGGILHTFSFLTESWHRAKARLRGTPKRLPECIELWRLCQGYSQHIPKRTVRALRRIAVSFFAQMCLVTAGSSSPQAVQLISDRACESIWGKTTSKKARNSKRCCVHALISWTIRFTLCEHPTTLRRTSMLRNLALGIAAALLLAAAITPAPASANYAHCTEQPNADTCPTY
jgi:hypothetical protein